MADGNNDKTETQNGRMKTSDSPKRHVSAPFEQAKKRVGDLAWLKPADAYLAAFLIPAVIMVIIFIQRGIFPFGENSFLRTDMYHQYAPFFSEFKHKLSTGGSLLYSWDVGLGVNFSALYAYYLASPLNWLIILCPKAYVIEFMTVMIVIKIGLSGLCMAYYLRRHSRRFDFSIALFGVFYALSGYMAAYSWNIMWLDCIAVFPLICLGLERLVNENKGILYCVTLGLSITSNYYISIMICMFMIIYFVGLLIMRGATGFKSFFKSVGRFVFYSILAGGISAAVLLPEIFALQSTASGDFSFPKTFSSYFSIFDMLARHMGNIECEIGLDHWPNIYCGVAVYILVILYIVNKKIKLKEKIVYLVTITVFFASFSINVLNYIWHGFHYPNSLPCRQSFIYVFLVLFICYRAVSENRGNTVKHLGYAFLISIAYILLCQKFIDQKHFSFWVYYIALIFTGLYGLIIFLLKTGRGKKIVVGCVLLGLVCVEAAINTTITSVTTTSRTEYTKDNAGVIELVNLIQEEDNSFYRFDKVNRKSKDDGAWMNFHSVSLFSSTANADLSTFFRHIGCESSTNAYSITGATPLVDSLFDVKYALYADQPDNDRINYIAESQGVFLYKNPDVMELCFLIPQNLEQNWFIDQNDPADVQNDLCSVMNTDPVLIPMEDAYTDGNIFNFTGDEKGQYYVFVTNSKVDKVSVGYSEKTKDFDNVKRGFLLELGTVDEGESISITADDTEQQLTAVAYRFDYDALNQLRHSLGSDPMNITSVTDSKIEGTVNAKEACRLMTSIPYDKGWSVTVDGVPKGTRKIFGAFLSVDIAKGEHSIVLSFKPQGLDIGILITTASIVIVLLIALFMFFTGRKKKNDKAGETDNVSETNEDTEDTDLKEDEEPGAPDEDTEGTDLKEDEEPGAPDEDTEDTDLKEDKKPGAPKENTKKDRDLIVSKNDKKETDDRNSVKKAIKQKKNKGMGDEKI